MSDERQNLTGKPPLTDEERVLLRTRALKQNKGRWWSKGMQFAENSVYGEPPAGYEAGDRHWKQDQAGQD